VNVLAYSIDVVVVEIKADFDPYGGEYTMVSFGYKLPIPLPPHVDKVFPPPPKPIYYKHGLHVFIPREKWTGQYNMWEEYHLIVKDDGVVELKKKEV
jgi:hypothetical protein